MSKRTTILLIALALSTAHGLAAHLLGEESESGARGTIAYALVFLVDTALTAVAFMSLQKRAVAREQKLAHAILEAVPDGVMTIAADGKICTLNPAAAKAFGYEPDDLIGKNVTALMPVPFAAIHDDALHSYHAVGSTVIGLDREIQGLRSDGSTFPLEIRVSVMPGGGGAFFVGILRDATDSKALTHKLQTALETAEQANRCKSDFLASMSHEIRTPMTAILGYTEIIASEQLEEAEFEEAAAAIKRSGDHLLDLINDVLDFSKIEVGKLKIETLHTSPFELVEGLREIMAQQAEEQGLKLIVDYCGELPEKIDTDPTRLRQVLINLVGNAIKFTPAGTIRVSVSMCEQPQEEGTEAIEFEVSDTGIGIAPEALERLFEPFEQADTSVARRYGGTGLGLSISKRIATLLGGEIWAESELGQGSRFFLSVDAGFVAGEQRMTVAQWRTTVAEQQQSATVVGSWSDYSVLLAEDNVVNREIITRMLKGAGVRVVAVEDGYQAVASALRALDGGRPYDLILMDMQMPVLDGWEATRQLRDFGYSTPIVGLTASSTSEAREECLAAGCDAFETKPVSREQLMNLISVHRPLTCSRAS